MYILHFEGPDYVIDVCGSASSIWHTWYYLSSIYKNVDGITWKITDSIGTECNPHKGESLPPMKWIDKKSI